MTGDPTYSISILTVRFEMKEQRASSVIPEYGRADWLNAKIDKQWREI